VFLTNTKVIYEGDGTPNKQCNWVVHSFQENIKNSAIENEKMDNEIFFMEIEAITLFEIINS
jgi:hypothetical protein